MPEVIIKYKNAKALAALTDFAKYFDIVIQKPKLKKAAPKDNADLPIDFAEKPDITALKGIWKNKEITLELLREKAWGSRR